MTGDPRRDAEATPHDFESLPVSDYDAEAAARQQHEAAKSARTCLRIIPYEQRQSTWTDVYCRRPAGHDGDCRPVPLAGDKEET